MKNLIMICIVTLSIMTAMFVHAQALFEEHIIQENFSQTMSVYAIDLDKDGDIDVLGAAYEDNTIAWWENDGNQNFATHIVTDNFNGVRTIWANDLDKDGDVDILGAAFGGNAIAWWENDGTQNFMKHNISTNFTGAHTVYTLDMDYDGDMDVIASAWSTKGIRWWENDGNQNFTSHSIDQNGDQYPGVHFADLDNDNDMDVIGCIYGNNQISWYENDGSQSFTKHILSSSFNSAHWVYAKDVDGDGDEDILGAAYGSSEVAWWENGGNKNFSKHTITTKFPHATSVFADDLDGDGDIDVLSAAETAGEIRWWENDGDQNFIERFVSKNFSGASHAHAADVDSDGDMDILGAARFGNKICWFESIDLFLVADFATKPISGHVPLSVQFKDSSYAKPSVTSWQWDFNNDGTVDSQDQNPQWTFETPGSYTVKLIVANNSLSDTLIKEDFIQIFDGESALLFDGTNGCATCAATPNLNLTDAVTIEAWIKPSGWGSLPNMGFGRIVDKKNISLFLNGQGGSLSSHSLVVWLTTENGSPGFSNAPDNTINLDEWQHVAVTYEGSSSTVKIYINGIEQMISQATGQLSGNISDNSSVDLRIGNGATPFIFDGAIDEVRVWNIARTAEEIQTHKNHYLQGNETGLVGYWLMNEGCGNTINDVSGNNNSGSLDKVNWSQGMNLNPPTAVRDDQQFHRNQPETFSLVQNYPNPFNSTTTIKFSLSQPAHLKLKIYDINGRLARSISNGKIWAAGKHLVQWHGVDDSGRGVGSGLYFCKITTEESTKTLKLLLIK